MREPHGRRRVEAVHLDTAEVLVLLDLAGRQLDRRYRRSRGRSLREMDLHPLRVQVVAGFDAPAHDGESRFRRGRIHLERDVRMQELGLVAPGVDEILKEAGRRIGVPFRALHNRTQSARFRFRRDAGKHRCANGRNPARRRPRPRGERGRAGRQRAREHTPACEEEPSQERRPRVHPIDSIQSPGPRGPDLFAPRPPGPGTGPARSPPVRDS